MFSFKQNLKIKILFVGVGDVSTSSRIFECSTRAKKIHRGCGWCGPTHYLARKAGSCGSPGGAARAVVGCSFRDTFFYF